jgi:hypothetical protein
VRRRTADEAFDVIVAAIRHHYRIWSNWRSHPATGE